MDGLRSIYFVYKDEDSHTACYLKEFFKWIGFTYFDETYNEELIDDMYLENKMYQFDIYVDIQGVLELYCGSNNVRDRFDFIKLKTESVDENDEDLLLKLLEIINDKIIRNERRFDELKKISSIYISAKSKKSGYRVVELVCEYTFILMQYMDVEEKKFILDSHERVVKELQALKEDIMDMKEYLLYAIINEKKYINQINEFQNQSLTYPVPELIDGANEIYEFDEELYKIEFLKASIVGVNCTYDSFVWVYLKKAIEKCPVEICKAFLYYSLGKCLGKYGQKGKEREIYHLSFLKNNRYIKTLYKLAMGNKRVENYEKMGEYLNRIIQLNKGKYKYKNIRTLEYLYKSYENLRVYNRQEVEDEFKNYINSYSWQSGKSGFNEFIDQIYSSAKLRNTILRTFKVRINGFGSFGKVD